MKKVSRLLNSLLFVLAAILLVTCSKDNGFDESLVVGTWQASDGYTYVFNQDHTGRRADAQNMGFDTSWSMQDDELTIKYLSNGSGFVSLTEIYIIEKLSSTHMEAYEMTFPDKTVKFEKQ